MVNDKMERLPDELIRLIRSYVFLHSWRADLHLDKLESRANSYKGTLNHYMYCRPLRRYIREYTKKMARLIWHPVQLTVVRECKLAREMTSTEYWMELVLLSQEEGCENPFEWNGCDNPFVWKGCLTRELYMEKCLHLSGL
jgi:hypothetical protein